MKRARTGEVRTPRTIFWLLLLSIYYGLVILLGFRLVLMIFSIQLSYVLNFALALVRGTRLVVFRHRGEEICLSEGSGGSGGGENLT
jgi:hypothetical protein